MSQLTVVFGPPKEVSCGGFVRYLEEGWHEVLARDIASERRGIGRAGCQRRQAHAERADPVQVERRSNDGPAARAPPGHVARRTRGPRHCGPRCERSGPAAAVS